MKKLLCVLLALAMVVAMVGCGAPAAKSSAAATSKAAVATTAAATKAAATTAAATTAAAPATTAAMTTGQATTGNTTSGTPVATGSNAKKWKIAVVPKMTSIAWFERMANGIKEYNQKYGDNVFYGGSTEGADQASYVEGLLAQNYDAIICVPFDVEAMEPVLKKAMDKGIVVVTHEAAAMTNMDYDVEAFDNVAIGEVMMKNIGESVGGKGKYIQLVGALTSKTHAEWTGGAEAYQKKNFPDMQLIGKYETNDDTDQAYNKVKEALTANPDIVAVQGSASTDLAGASRAVEELGLKGKVTLVGFSLYSVSGQYVKEGTAKGYYFWDSAQAGEAAVEIAKGVLGGYIDDIKAHGLADDFIKGYKVMTLKDKTFYANSYVYIDKSNVDDKTFQY